ncbi:unnamed protein product [Dovyalis caffra]|uniref:Uncharacterized protein n=1 Tax=Dovyalis caffra TaxID=77055 RepID=A0AAV1SCK3_9ROSI|nr:unnamed protein product [Dovyalis caffra]
MSDKKEGHDDPHKEEDMFLGGEMGSFSMNNHHFLGGFDKENDGGSGLLDFGYGYLNDEYFELKLPYPAHDDTQLGPLGPFGDCSENGDPFLELQETLETPVPHVLQNGSYHPAVVSSNEEVGEVVVVEKEEEENNKEGLDQQRPPSPPPPQEVHNHLRISYTSDLKPRLRWTHELHSCFVNAVKELGGAQNVLVVPLDGLRGESGNSWIAPMILYRKEPLVNCNQVQSIYSCDLVPSDRNAMGKREYANSEATPRSVQKLMDVEGLTLFHVKSHLQKYRQGRYSVRYSESRKTAAQGIEGPTNSVNLPPVEATNQPNGNSKAKKEERGSLYLQIQAQRAIQRYVHAHRSYLDIAINNACKLLSNQCIGGAAAQNSTGSGNEGPLMPYFYQNEQNASYAYNSMEAVKAQHDSFQTNNSLPVEHSASSYLDGSNSTLPGQGSNAAWALDEDPDGYLNWDDSDANILAIDYRRFNPDGGAGTSK